MFFFFSVGAIRFPAMNELIKLGLPNCLVMSSLGSGVDSLNLFRVCKGK